jgi:ribosomal protein S18 acetylase RimI-like enzyme
VSSHIALRPSVETDIPLLSSWINQPDVLCWFPMSDQREIDDSVRIWTGYIRIGASFTAEYQGEPAGMAVLYLQPYKRFSHHALFAIIVDSRHRNLGVGRALIQHFEKEAREKFSIELLHLEVYDGNPAIRLYERMGFREYGRHPRFIKENGKYICKILMQKDISHGRT